MNQFSLMARFGGWANERLYGAVSGLSEDAYRKDGGAFFGSIHNTLNHLLVVDRLWTGRIEGRDRGITALDQILHDDFSSLREARTAEDRRLIDEVDGLSDAALERPVTYRRIIGDGEQKTRCDHILLTL
ncbi:MAG: DinB family protein, partial [Rhodospirillales bacterium]|nr:DinB family protein [Rhodospirillales bacterium]